VKLDKADDLEKPELKITQKLSPNWFFDHGTGIINYSWAAKKKADESTSFEY